MAARRPKYDGTRQIPGRMEGDEIRVRVYATRQEYEVLLGDGDIADPDSPVWCFPKIGDGLVWADEGVRAYVADLDVADLNGKYEG